MPNKINYEWVIELIGDDDDIIEVSHADTYKEAAERARLWLASPPYPIYRIDIGLVRDVGNDIDGIIDRSWAYVIDGKLEEIFNYGVVEETGAKVPQRFLKEVAAS